MTLPAGDPIEGSFIASNTMLFEAGKAVPGSNGIHVINWDDPSPGQPGNTIGNELAIPEPRIQGGVSEGAPHIQIASNGSASACVGQQRPRCSAADGHGFQSRQILDRTGGHVWRNKVSL